MFSGLMSLNDALAVRVIERFGHLPGDTLGGLDRERAITPEALPQALAFHHGHGVPELPGGPARIEDRQDVWVLEPSGEADLAKETLLGTERFRQLRVG